MVCSLAGVSPLQALCITALIRATLATRFALRKSHSFDEFIVALGGWCDTDIPFLVSNSCNEDTVTIVDVTNKSNPVELSRTTYSGVKYTHQGWLTEDHNTFIFGDEVDEYINTDREKKTTSYVLNVEDLENPLRKSRSFDEFVVDLVSGMILTFPFLFLAVAGTHVASKNAIDHNMYTLGDYVYQTNYASGLQVLKIGDVATSPDLTEIAFFDVYPESDEAEFVGAWSNYPYFPSGNVVVSSIDRGLFVLKVNKDGPPLPGPECRLEPNKCTAWFGLVEGYTMHKTPLLPFLFGGEDNCRVRCTSESHIESRQDRGWECGSSCE